MKKTPVTKRSRIFCLLFALIFCSALLSVSVYASDTEKAVVSPGLYVLAEQNTMAKAGIKGNGIKFESADFARALNLPVSSLGEITFTSVPPITDGELRVGGTVLNAGQSVSTANLSLLSYSPSSDIAVSSFKFRVGDSPLEMTCKLYMLDSVNNAPTLSIATQEALTVSTHCNMTLYGTLPSYDPDGDQVTIEIVAQPKSGLIKLSDRHTGDYVYTPLRNASGKDSFTYVARDKYGNYSASATVSLTIVKPSVSVTYADMDGSPYANAALTMTEKGIMSGTQVGSEVYFYPEQTVSRAEFVVLAMNSLGIKSVSADDCPGFADSTDIPAEMAGYIATACRMGYVKGSMVDGELCFEPDRTITRAEAAVILSNMLDASVPTGTILPSFDDAEAIPSWAEASLYSMNYLGILKTEDRNIQPMQSVTRADAAAMLAEIVEK